MKSKYNILVTGCGGDIGQSIGKILKSHSLFNRVVGCDMSDEHAGKFIFDELLKVPACSSLEYGSALEKIVKKLEVDLILPISEHELRFFTEKKTEHFFLDKPLICASLGARVIGFDKFATAEFLKSCGLPFPETNIAGNMKDAALPLVLKNRMGSGSKSIFILNNKDDFNFYKKKYPDYIVQELLEDDNAEYTCGLHRFKNGEIRTIIYRRKMVDSYSGFGVTVENEAINRLLIRIGDCLALCGSINVQLRLKNNIPYVFEINPRFSSTVMFRHLMGFTDVIWSIEDILGLKLSPYKAVQPGKHFYKGFHEYID